MPWDKESLDTLFYPESIAVVGASQNSSKFGGRAYKLIADSFTGSVFPVNPGGDTIRGQPVFKRLLDVPRPLDHVVIAVPASRVAAEMTACAEMGVRAVSVFSSNFAEVGAEGKREQDRVAAIAAEAGIRVLGPNTLGFFNTRQSLYASFSTVYLHGLSKPGGIGMVSQSGAIGALLFALARNRGLGFSLSVATGNECDVSVGEVVRYLAEDPGTSVIFAYMEGCQDPENLVEGLRIARQQHKPVVIMKVGSSGEGASAAASHTGSLVGADTSFGVVFEEYGVHRAVAIDEALDVLQVCSGSRWPNGHRVGIGTLSGGGGIILADAAVRAGLEVPELSASIQETLKGLIPFAGTRNPVDMTAAAIADVDLLDKFIDTMLLDPSIDVLLLFLSIAGLEPDLAAKVKAVLLGIRARHPEKPITTFVVGDTQDHRDLTEAGLPVFDDPVRMVQAVAALVRFGQHFDRPESQVGRMAVTGRAVTPGPLNEAEVLRLLAGSGISVVPTKVVHSPEEAAQAAAAIGFPVVQKILSAAIAHKSDVGGVLLDIASESEAAEGFAELLRRAKRVVPEAEIEGVIVAPMIRDGVETILGAKIDPTFGPLVVFGLGGVFVELLGDTVVRLAPINEAQAMEMIRASKGFKLLSGARGKPGMDLSALAGALVALSQLIAANRTWMESIDVNPFIALPAGGVAVDGLLVPKTQTEPMEGGLS